MSKRIKAVLLTLSVMLFSIIPFHAPTVYATNVNGISVSKTQVTPNDELTVSVTIPAASSNADTASMRVEFNADVFAVKSWSSGVYKSTDGQGEGFFSLSSSNTAKDIDLSHDLTVSAQLSVKSTATDGTYSIKLVKNSFSYVDDDGYTYHELWNPTVSEVSVTVSGSIPPTNLPVSGGGISVSKSSLATNEAFTVSINIPKISENADTASIKVEFDPNSFEVVTWNSGIAGATDGKGDGLFSVSAANSERNIDLSNGLTLTASMKVKSSATDKSYTFKLTKYSLSYVKDDGYTYQELWNPTTQETSLTVLPNPIPPNPTDIPVSGGGISVSSTQIKTNDRFKVFINVPVIPKNADTASLKVEYDADAFEVESWTSGVAGSTDGTGSGYFSVSAANSDPDIILNQGLILTANMKAKNVDSSKAYTFKLTKSSLSYVEDDGYTYTELWLPTTTSVNVNGNPPAFPITGGGISASKTKVAPNESFTVSINVPKISENADTSSIRVEFDPDAFEVVSWTSGVSGATDGKGAGYFSLSASNTAKNIILSNGLTLSATIKAKSGITDKPYTFRLTKNSLSYVEADGYTYQELWTPSTTSVTVNGSTTPDIPVVGGGITLSKSQITQDDTFTATITIPALPMNADAASVKVEFDSSAFEIVTWNPTLTGGTGSKGNNFFMLSASNTNINAENGLTFTANIKAKKNAGNGTYYFKFTDNSFSNSSSGIKQELWTPSNKTASIKINIAPIPGNYPVEGGGISLSKSKVKAGETFTATVTVPAIAHNADTASIRVEFDSTAFEVKSWNPNISGGVTNSGSGYFILSASNANKSIDLGKGLTLTATMCVKNSARSGSSSFNLKTSSISFVDDDGYTNIELWKPKTTTTSITVTTAPTPVPVNLPVSGGGISLSQSTVNIGGSFMVYVMIPATGEYADTSSIRVEFDQNAFEVISWNPNIYGGVPTYGSGYFSFAASNASRNIDLRNGLTLTATLNVRNYANIGNYDFRLTRGSFSYVKDNGYQYQEMWEPVDKIAYLRVVSGGGNGGGGNGGGGNGGGGNGGGSNGGGSNGGGSNGGGSNGGGSNGGGSDGGGSNGGGSNSGGNNGGGNNGGGNNGGGNNGGGNNSGGSNGNNGNDGNTTKPKKVNITLESELTGLQKGKIRVSTKYDFFSGDTIIYLRNTDSANKMASKALRQLNMSNHEYYAFDISVYDVDSGTYISSLPGGYIEFNIPLPRNMQSVPRYISVYHTENGTPEYINCNIVNDDGQNKIQFRTNSFSPYMFVDAVNEKQIEVVDTGNKIITDNNNNNDNNYNGYSNPNTGAAAAIIIPAALTGCIILAKKDKQHRKRSKRK